MNPSKKKSLALMGLLILLAPLIQASATQPSEQSAKELAPRFLSEVIGLDLTKYNLTNEGYSADYPVYYGGEVKEESYAFDLVSAQGKLTINSVLLNGFIDAIYVYYVSGSVIYSRQPSTNPIEESRTILQNYKTFAQKQGWKTLHVDRASEMLSNVSEETSKNTAHTFNGINGFASSVIYAEGMKLETTNANVRWVYTENETEIALKRLYLNFGFNTLTFADKWNIYDVGSLSLISEEEAKSIGWEAAKNYNWTFTYENGTIIPETARWSNVSEINFGMRPGQKYKINQNDFVDPGSLVREPLSLYPLWQMKFYFGKDVVGAAGVNVGVWGDTKEIAFIDLFGYLGTVGVPDSSIHEGQPEDTKSNPPKEDLIEDTEVPIQSQSDKTKEIQDAASIGPSPKGEQSAETSPNGNNNPTIEYALTGGALTIVASIAIAWFVLKKKSK